MTGVNNCPPDLLNNINESSANNNSWVICKSKSHPGINYYFNTLTGESKWDLSEAERAKARNLTQKLPCTELEKYSEPKIPPGQSSGVASTIYTKQIINNKYSNHLPAMNTYPGAPEGSFDTKIWSTPPNAQLGIGAIPGQYIIVSSPLISAMTPLINPPNINYGAQQQIEYHPSQQPFQRNNSNYKPHRGRGRGRGGFSRQYKKPIKNNFNSTDLRLKLKRSRRNSISQNWGSWEDANNEIGYDDNAEHNRNDFLQETPSKHDLSKVKQLISSDSRSNIWLIVVDIDILVNEFKFLNKLTNPEQNCYLLVPDHVMCELQARASGYDANVKRIHKFLTEQMECENAYRGEDVSDRAEDDCDKTFVTCSDWAERDNVILLSNDTKYQKYRYKNNNVHVLTMGELKYTMECGPMKQEPVPMNAIKIMVPNNVQENINTIDHSPQKSLESKQQSSPLEPPPIRKLSTEPVKASTSTQTIEITAKDQIPTESKQIEPATDSSVSKRTSQEIKLNRNFTVSTPNVVDKKPIKLRRWRRNPVSQDTNSSLVNNDTSDKNTLDATFTVEKLKHVKKDENDKLSKTSTIRDPSSDRSSVSSPSKKHAKISKTIDESSSSTKTNNSNNCVKSKRFTMRIAVMFEVEDQTMEEGLRTRRDEWVIRFVQIMEEVLRQKLLGKSGLHLHEGVKCIIREYSNDFNVVDAANKLSFVLHQISDEFGNIKESIEPSEYMDMYSYGVYLIETLKDVTDNCEDLNSAHESLKKLLSDIKATNLDASQDTLNEEDINDAQTSERSMIEQEQEQSTDINATVATEDYNQSGKGSPSRSRSLSRSLRNVQENEQQAFVRSESSLASNPKPGTKFQDEPQSQGFEIENSSNKESNHSNKYDRRRIPLSPRSPQSPTENWEEQRATENETSADTNCNKTTCIINISRNFVTIPKYEEKYRSKTDEVDLDVHRDERSNQPKGYSNGNCDEENVDREQTVKDDYQETKNNIEVVPHEMKLRDDTFKRFVQKFIGEITRILKKTKDMCYEIMTDESDPNGIYTNNIDKAEKVGDVLDKISDSISGLLVENTNGNENNIRQLLINGKKENYVPSEQILAEYKDVISSCKEQTDDLRYAITLIVDMARKKRING